MKVHELKTTKDKSIKRLGRGISGGQGKTAGRGTKGQNARAGSKFKPGFEGGQTKLAQRLPKARGFTPLNRIEFQVVNLSDIQNLGKKVVDANILRSAGLIRRVNSPVKLLGNGTIKIATTISVEKASASAISAIESAGGKVILTAKPKMITKRKKEFNK
ncbi:MAG: 50S ribosomal protein L15 [Patescibacteria group bacterium]|nr:50S ribosomal protein L15 [Patescibacteria group bacterium]